jgi:hypothetical protein
MDGIVSARRAVPGRRKRCVAGRERRRALDELEGKEEGGVADGDLWSFFEGGEEVDGSVVVLLVVSWLNSGLVGVMS